MALFRHHLLAHETAKACEGPGLLKQIAAGESASAGIPTPQTDDDDDDLSGGALAVLLLAVGGAVAGVLYAAFHNNDLNFGGSVTVISPTK